MPNQKRARVGCLQRVKKHKKPQVLHLSLVILSKSLPVLAVVALEIVNRPRHAALVAVNKVLI